MKILSLEQLNDLASDIADNRRYGFTFQESFLQVADGKQVTHPKQRDVLRTAALGFWLAR